MATTAPAAEVLASPGVWDATKNRLVMLVGGLSRGPTSLWEWDGTTWAVASVAGPVATMDVPLVSLGGSI